MSTYRVGNAARTPEVQAEPQRTSWYYGDGPEMLCPKCHSEVWGFKEGYICSSPTCDYSEDHEQDAQP